MAESLADMVLGFFEEGYAAGSSGSDDGWISGGEDNSVGIAGGGVGGGEAETRAFWKLQGQLLQEALMRIGSTETKIRGSVNDAVEKLRASGATFCVCSGGGETAAGNECNRGYLLREIANWLREMGYDSAVCRSKWRRSPDIPAGEHCYIEVIRSSKCGLKESTRILIEPNFRAEFEVARGSPEYNSLVAQLPEIFVGKSERLKSVVKVMCRAAKCCMKENRMHMGPWRKQQYMLSKWLGTCERLFAPVPPKPAAKFPEEAARQPRPRASMLTFDMLRTAVKVV